MENTIDLMKQRLLSILSGEYYKGTEHAWDTFDVWADASDFYYSLADARMRADFEHVIVEFLYGDKKPLRDFALMMCYELKIRAAIPRLLYLVREQPNDPKIGTVCMALGAMQVAEAADFLEANNYAADLFRIDFRRAIPLIQRLVERTCVGGYDRHRAKMPPRPALSEMEKPLHDLYARFGVKGIFLLLEELDIANEDHRSFVLDAVIGVSYEVMSRKMIIMSQYGQRLTQEQSEVLETERRVMVDEVKQWLQSRVRFRSSLG